MNSWELLKENGNLGNYWIEKGKIVILAKLIRKEEVGIDKKWYCEILKPGWNLKENVIFRKKIGCKPLIYARACACVVWCCGR